MRVIHVMLAAPVVAAAALALFARHPDTGRTERTATRRTENVLFNPAPESVRRQMEERFRPSDQARMRARRLFESGDIAGAEAECRKALDLAPHVNGAPANPLATELMGEICLREGKDREALTWFLEHFRHAAGGTSPVYVTIAYCRLGDYQNAKRYFPGGPAFDSWKPWGGVSPRDRPGTSSLAALEASALLSLGIEAAAEDRRDEAILDYLAAERLAPRNPMIAYCLADLYELRGDAVVALPRLRVAATAQSPEVRKRAQKGVASAEYWLKLHPPATAPSAAPQAGH